MTMPRQYVQKERARRHAETRRRITEAAVGLHVEVGPGATRIADIARRAGVQRATVYNHFPDDRSLFAACSAHWRATHPAPDTAPWLEIDDAAQRARATLSALYGWYRETAVMTHNVLRDSQTIPALREVISGGLLRYLARVAEALAAPFAARGARPERVAAASAAVVEFAFWQALAPLGDEAAADLGAGLLELAASGP